MSAVARHIEQRRIELNMTQDTLADKLSVSTQTVSNWETGQQQPDIDTLVRMAEVLKTDVNGLIYGSPQEPNRKDILRGLCISGGITLLLGLTYIIGMPIAKELRKQFFNSIPYLLLQNGIVPLFLFVLAWTLLQGLFAAGLLKPLPKGRKPLFFTSLGVLFILLLPIIVFNVDQMVAFFLEIYYRANQALYPEGFSYQGILPRFFYIACYRFNLLGGEPFVFLAAFLLGMACWLTKPRKKPRETLSGNTEDNPTSKD